MTCKDLLDAVEAGAEFNSETCACLVEDGHVKEARIVIPGLLLTSEQVYLKALKENDFYKMFSSMRLDSATLCSFVRNAKVMDKEIFVIFMDSEGDFVAKITKIIEDDGDCILACERTTKPVPENGTPVSFY